MFVGTSRI